MMHYDRLVKTLQKVQKQSSEEPKIDQDWLKTRLLKLSEIAYPKIKQGDQQDQICKTLITGMFEFKKVLDAWISDFEENNEGNETKSSREQIDNFMFFLISYLESRQVCNWAMMERNETDSIIA